MKATILALTFLTTFSAFATTTYSNNSGCSVEVENRRNGVVYYVTQGNKSEVLGVTNDLSSGTFVYCDESALGINFTEGKKATGILMSCSEHVNGNSVTRGRAEIEIANGSLTRISIDGQVKGFFGWKQDSKVECSNLVKDN